jgi:effector-binding domain-containing protein
MVQNSNEVEMEQLEPQQVLSIRETIQVARLGEVMGERIAALSDYLRQRGAQPAGPPFVRYHTFGESETDMEFGVPVAGPIAGEGRIAAGELPGGPAVTTWHDGPDDKLGEAYARLGAFVTEHGRELDGPAREVYHWIDLGQAQDPASSDPGSRRIQLIQPVK